MGWLLINEAHWFPRILKRKAIKEWKNPDKPATNPLTDTEDIDNENHESSKNFEMEIIFEVALDEMLIVPDKAKVTIQLFRKNYKVID